MIENISIVLKGDIAVSYETERGTESLLFSDMKPYWDYANADEIEAVRIYKIDDQETLLIIFLMASGQGGVIVGWNTVQRRIEHISEAAYAVAAVYREEMIYILKVVSNYQVSAHFTLEKISYGIKDAWAEAEEVAGTALINTDDYTGNFDDVDLYVDYEKVRVRLKDKVSELCSRQ